MAPGTPAGTAAPAAPAAPAAESAAPGAAPAAGRRHRDEVPLGWYPAFLRRHRALVAITVLLGLLAGAAAVVHRGRVYTATVELIAAQAPVGVAPQLNGRQVRPATIDTEAQLLRSGAVLDAAAAALGRGTTAGEVAAALHVAVPQATRLLVVSYDSGSAERSTRAVSLVTREYLRLRTGLIESQRDQQIASLQTYLDALQRNESAGRGQNGVAAGFVRAATRRVIRELQDLRATPVRPGELTDPAGPRVVAAVPNASVPLTGGALLGLLAGVTAGLLLDRRRRRIHTVADAAAICRPQLVTRVAVDRLDRPVRDRRLRNVVLLGWSAGARVTVTGAGRRVGAAVARGLAEELGSVTDRAWLVHDGVAVRATPGGRAPAGDGARGEPAAGAPDSWLVLADDVDSGSADRYLARQPVDLVVLPVVLGHTGEDELRRAYAWRYDPNVPVVLVVVRRVRRHRLAARHRRRPGRTAGTAQAGPAGPPGTTDTTTLTTGRT